MRDETRNAKRTNRAHRVQTAGTAPPGTLPCGAGSFASTLTSDPACHKVFQLEAAHGRRDVRLALPQPAIRPLNVCRAWPHGFTSTAEAQLGHSASSSLNSRVPATRALAVSEWGRVADNPPPEDLKGTGKV